MSSEPALTTPPSTRTVGDVAADSGVATSAVRFYERYGVITATRTATNQRRFDESAACRIKVAKLAQRVGLTIREIADVFADLPADPDPQDWGRIAETLIAEAEARTAELRARLADIRTGTKLCEIIDHIDDHASSAYATTR
jgi:MerR family transcriptional regulator, redox-sensitive transcriptional activator SoxR